MRNIRCIPFHDYDRLYFMELENQPGMWGYRNICRRCGFGAGLLSHTHHVGYEMPSDNEMFSEYHSRKP